MRLRFPVFSSIVVIAGLAAAPGCASRNRTEQQRNELCAADACPPLAIVNLPPGLSGPSGEHTINLTFDTTNPAQCIVLTTPMASIGPATLSLDIWYSLAHDQSFTYSIVCTDIFDQTISTELTLTASAAGADVVETVVAETMAGSMTMEQAASFARAAGLIVSGDVGEFPRVITLVDPWIGDTVLTISESAQIKAATLDPGRDTQQCDYKGVKFRFDGSGKLFGLSPRPEGYRIVVHNDVPNGIHAASAGCRTWNSAVPGQFQEPTITSRIPWPIFSTPFLYIRCMSDAESKENRSRAFANTATYAASGLAVERGVITVDCKDSHANDPGIMAYVVQHECGHAVGLADFESDTLEPRTMYKRLRSWADAAQGPKPIPPAAAEIIRTAWDPLSIDLGTGCFKYPLPLPQLPPCEGSECGGGDPCAGNPCGAGCPAADSCECNPGRPGCDPCSNDSCAPGCPDANRCECNPSFCTPCDADPYCCGDPACVCDYNGGVWDGRDCYSCRSDACQYCTECYYGGACPDQQFCGWYVDVCHCFPS